MAVQSNVQATIAIKEESTFGTAPGATGGQLLRRVSSSLSVAKDTFTSNEVRSDQQISDMRHGMRSARGTIEGELSALTFDLFMQAALRSTFAAPQTVAPADFATGVTIANTTVNGIACSTLTFVGAGNLLTKSFKVGDVVRTTGFTNAANNQTTIGNLRIVALTATVMTVFPQLVASAQQGAGWLVSGSGQKLLCGTTKKSFTIEQSMADASIFELFTGVRVNGFSVNAPPNGVATISWDLMGRAYAQNAAAYFTTPTAETTTGIVSGVDGFLRVNGVEQAVLTGFSLNFTNNMSMAPVIGSTFAPDIFYGRMVATGSVSAYLENPDLVNAFLNEAETDIVATLEASGAAPQSYVNFNMQRVKFTGAQKQLTGDGGVIVQMPFQALLATGGAGTNTDQTTLSIQRA